MWYPISFPPLQLSVWSKCAPTHFGWSSCLFCPFIWPSMPLLNLLYMRCVMAFKVWWHQIFEIALSRTLRSFDNLLSNVPSQPLKFNIIDCYHHFMKFVYGKRTIATRTQTEYRLLCSDYIFRIQLASWIRKQSYVYILFEYSIKYPYLQTRAIHSCKWYMCVWCLFSSNAYCCSKWVYCINCWISNNCLNARVLKCGYV